MYFLKTRAIKYKKQDRMWFKPEALVTEALLKIKGRFRNKIELELLNVISEIMDSYNLEEFHFTNKDAIELLRSNNIKLTRGDVKRIIDNWKIPLSDNTFNYTTYKYDTSGIIYEAHLKGRYYTLKGYELRKILMI